MYGSVANVRTITGLRPGDVGFGTDDELDTWLTEKLEQIAVMIEKDRERDEASFTAEGWTIAIDGIADRWGAAFVRFVMANRDSPIVRVDDFNVEMPNENVPGEALMKELALFPREITKRFVFESGVVKAAPENATGF